MGEGEEHVALLALRQAGGGRVRVLRQGKGKGKGRAAACAPKQATGAVLRAGVALLPLPHRASAAAPRQPAAASPTMYRGEWDRPACMPTTPQVSTPPRPWVLKQEPKAASILSSSTMHDSSRHRLDMAARGTGEGRAGAVRRGGGE